MNPYKFYLIVHGSDRRYHVNEYPTPMDALAALAHDTLADDGLLFQSAEVWMVHPEYAYRQWELIVD